ncbi:MAG: triose-phosphate isomerase [Alphaproteobacteria bacterium]|nr:MAG: triose-phosphate isomerase [Alphaproteobacteria bacterium]
MRRKLIAGNWKMNGLRADGVALAAALAAKRPAAEAGEAREGAPELLICPPAQLLFPVAEVLAGSDIQLGGQDCHSERCGPHTGDISAEMLRDAGCRYVIVGHSERRTEHGEDDALVRAKAEAAQAAGLVPIVCIGESAAERAAGRTLPVIEAQLLGSIPQDGNNHADALVIAYEPVWAIGTGQSATPADVAAAHGHIRRLLRAALGAEAAAAVRLLYGGSVKPANAAELLAVADVDGALVGGASLKAEDFLAIAAACP